MAKEVSGEDELKQKFDNHEAGVYCYSSHNGWRTEYGIVELCPWNNGIDCVKHNDPLYPPPCRDRVFKSQTCLDDRAKAGVPSPWPLHSSVRK